MRHAHVRDGGGGTPRSRSEPRYSSSRADVPKLAVPPSISRTATTESRASRTASITASARGRSVLPASVQHQAATDALEQRDAELGLQAANLLADRRLREVKRTFSRR